MTEEIEFRTHGMTVWFESMPEKNPFKIVSEYGEARSIGRGNIFDEAEILRQALEEIMKVAVGSEDFYDIANAALNRVDGAGWATKEGRKP